MQDGIDHLVFVGLVVVIGGRSGAGAHIRAERRRGFDSQPVRRNMGGS